MLRYAFSVKSLSRAPHFLISDYFAPSQQPNPTLPMLDEGGFRPLFSYNTRLREVIYDNETLKNPKKHRIQKTLKKRRAYGDNYERYLSSNVREEIKGVRDKVIYVHKNLADEGHPNNYEFKDQVDYFVPTDNFLQLRRLNSLTYLDLQDPLVANDFPLLAKSFLDHGSLHAPSYPLDQNPVAELKQNEVILHNLPLDIHPIDVVKKVEESCGKIKSLEFVRCVLGLPAYAKIAFKEPNSVVKAVQEIHWKLWGDVNLVSVKTNQDQQHEHAWNRTLCVMNIPPEMKETAVLEILSEYGRVMHYELPKEVLNPNLPSKEELVQYLSENPEYDIHGNRKPISVKIINHILDKGSIETYYVPKDKEDEKKDENTILNILESKSSDALKSRFIPREIYHTAEWSPAFLTTEERHKRDLLSEKYSKILGDSYSSPETEQEFEKIPKMMEHLIEGEPVLGEQERRNIRNAFDSKKMVNKGYCFVTYASADQAKLVLLRLNRARETFDLGMPVLATLKEDLEPYELDNDFIFQQLKRMKSRYLEFLHEVQKKGQTLTPTIKQELAGSKEYVDKILEGKDLRKNIEEVLERELFNDFENTTIGSLKPSENYDYSSVGRQNMLEVKRSDLKRLKDLIDGKLNKEIASFKKKSQSLDKILTEYISPLDHKKMAENLSQLRQEISIQAEKLYTERFPKHEKVAISKYIFKRMSKLIYEGENNPMAPNTSTTELFQLLKIDEDRYYEVIEDEAKKLRGLTENLLEVKDDNEGTNQNSQFELLVKETDRRERFLKFIRHLQKLLLGRFDSKMLLMFDQKGVPLDQSEVLIKYSKDLNGKEYLPKEEKERVMEYLLPENEDEKNRILKYEEEKLKFWDSLTYEDRVKFVDGISSSLPFQPLYEHEMGIPEKIFKPKLKPGQTIEQLVSGLNKEAELGFEYVHVKDSPQGDVIYKVVKPAYRVNIQKMGELDWDKMRTLSEKKVEKIYGLKGKKEVEKKMREEMEEIRKGKGILGDNMMQQKNVRKGIEELMKVTPFSRAEIEAILKADFRDPDVIMDIQKQFSIEKLKEMKKELKPDDFLKNKESSEFSHLKTKEGKHLTTKYKKL